MKVRNQKPINDIGKIFGFLGKFFVFLSHINHLNTWVGCHVCTSSNRNSESNTAASIRHVRLRSFRYMHRNTKLSTVDSLFVAKHGNR